MSTVPFLIPPPILAKSSEQSSDSPALVTWEDLHSRLKGADSTRRNYLKGAQKAMETLGLPMEHFNYRALIERAPELRQSFHATYKLTSIKSKVCGLKLCLKACGVEQDQVDLFAKIVNTLEDQPLPAEPEPIPLVLPLTHSELNMSWDELHHKFIVERPTLKPSTLKVYMSRYRQNMKIYTSDQTKFWGSFLATNPQKCIDHIHHTCSEKTAATIHSAFSALFKLLNLTMPAPPEDIIPAPIPASVGTFRVIGPDGQIVPIPEGCHIEWI